MKLEGSGYVRRRVWLALSLAFVSCGSRSALRGGDAGSGAPTPDVDGGVDAREVADVVTPDGPRAIYVAAVESFCDERSRLLCARLARCNLPPESALPCLVQAAKDCAAELDGWQPGAAARGNVAFDDTTARACYAALDEAPCFLGLLPPECSAVARPRAQNGAPCSRPEECLGGYCDLPFEGACGGTCASAYGPGHACVDGERGCALGVAFCDGASGMCVAARPLGASCARDQECQTGNYCASPRAVRCVEADPVDGINCRCAKKGAAGTPCVSQGQCEDGLVCPDGTCRGRSAAGEPCTTDSFLSCAGGLACFPLEPTKALGVCGPRVPVGAPCASDVCVDGATCARDVETRAAVCRGLTPLGQRCEVASDCRFDAYCDSTKVCRARPRLGEACDERSICWGGYLNCIPDETGAFKCGPPPSPPMGPCGGMFYCAEGLRCVNDSCRTPLAAGAGCESNEECSSGICGLTDQTGACLTTGPFPCEGTCTAVCPVEKLDDP